jgi:uncharacterized protein (DUF2252 family)
MVATTAGHRSASERAADGRAARSAAPRSAHADWQPSPDRADPVELLEEQARTRVPELVPIRYGRMLTSPLAFFRGAAAIMAADLASSPTSGITAQLCGDAHLSNFGAFAAPDRRLVIDINDFDETLPGPWEWDVKRLAASLAVAARFRGFDDRVSRRIVTAAVAAYRTTMRTLAAMRNLDVWYARVEADEELARLSGQVSGKALARARRRAQQAQHKDSLRAFDKLTREVDGERRIISDPPIVVPIRELVPEVEADAIVGAVEEILASYGRSLRDELRRLLESYRFVDLARKVVGVGSVGTRAWIALLLGRDEADPLFLQVKEAQASVLEPFLDASEYDNHGRRVVEGQRLLQTAPDAMLGWTSATGIDGQKRDFYVRQLWDWKLSADVEVMAPQTLEIYGRICGGALARGHGRSADRVGIAAYLGSGATFDRAIAAFAETYADQNDRDHRALASAVEQGRVEARAGV